MCSILDWLPRRDCPDAVKIHRSGELGGKQLEFDAENGCYCDGDTEREVPPRTPFNWSRCCSKKTLGGRRNIRRVEGISGVCSATAYVLCGMCNRGGSPTGV